MGSEEQRVSSRYINLLEKAGGLGDSESETVK